MPFAVNAMGGKELETCQKSLTHADEHAFVRTCSHRHPQSPSALHGWEGVRTCSVVALLLLLVWGLGQ